MKNQNPRNKNLKIKGWKSETCKKKLMGMWERKKKAYLRGSCWNREDMSFNGSVDEEEDEVGDVTSSNESDSNDETVLEASESEEDEVEEWKEP